MAPPSNSRLQVTCTSKTLRNGEKRISSIGGIDNEKFWSLSKAEAVSMILRGEKSFYVKESGNHQVEVMAVQGGFYNNKPWYFLQTQTDMIHENNLINLPDCTIGIQFVEIWY
ncbi:hypothetical protein B0A62_02820 [Flavobacterium hydatis]|uniref:Uncharacterized protein n=2 Tax=Flavobacterium hydatis TaxID=991 RepID=A0ABX4CMI6_FLAHY|nr:hypothetical protein B0A62_02820 [Flavobacterium hydatis]